MNTPPRQSQNTESGQPIQAGFQTPQRQRLEFTEPPPIVRRCSKKRRANCIIETDRSVANLGNLFNNINLEQ